MPTVEEIADISPICSIIVASEIGTIATIALIIREVCDQSTPPKIVLCHLIGKPNHGA